MPTLSKPRRRSRRLACENAYYEVFLDDLADDSGDVREYLVVAPKRSATYLVTGVAVLPVVKNRYALLRIYRHAIQDYSWEVPRGFVEDKEKSRQSVGRELYEETGLDCRSKSIRSLGYITPEAGALAARIHLFLAQDCWVKSPFNVREMGHQELRFLTEKQMAVMIQRSLIQDVSTIVAFHRSLMLKRLARPA